MTRRRLVYMSADGRAFETPELATLATDHHFRLVAAPRGIHAVLCRLGMHAWELRAASITGRSDHRHRRCAVCRRWETR